MPSTKLKKNQYNCLQNNMIYARKNEVFFTLTYSAYSPYTDALCGERIRQGKGDNQNITS